MQGLADGYFVLPYTIGDYLANEISTGPISTSSVEFDQAENEAKERINQLFSINGTKPVDYFHKKLGQLMWEYAGMSRNKIGLKKAIKEIAELRKRFWADVRVTGSKNSLNPELEKAGRVADLLELGELFAKDALERKESCGGHFREESVELGGPQKERLKEMIKTIHTFLPGNIVANHLKLNYIKKN